MKTLKTLSIYSAIALAAITSSCKKDDDKDNTTTTSNVLVDQAITENTTWTAGKIYEIKGRIFVKNNATLTIEPGTLIKGQSGQGANASVLIISRGAKIDAKGTASKPIVFTTVSDNITSVSGTSSLKKTDAGLWGGLVILGKAPISAKDGDTEGSIEGIPANDADGKYGGSDVADNSGTLSYVSVRHGGTQIAAGNEINGITFGGVGNGTTINNIEVFATTDDGIELFGGSVNLSNVSVYNQGDDGIDIDQNYSGTITNFSVVHGDEMGTGSGLEIDGPENSTHKDGRFTLKNGTVTSKSDKGNAGTFKSKAQGTVENTWFKYTPVSPIKIRASYTNECQDEKSDAFTNLKSEKLVFTGSKFDGVKVYTDSEKKDKTACPVKTADQTAAEGKMNSETATGADMGVFSWTHASKKGLL